jgi:hypothetical protein
MVRRESALQPVAKTFLAAGALALLIGGAAALAHAPAVLTPYALQLVLGGAIALVAGLIFAGAGALEQRLIDTELTLIETREQLKAAVEALRKAPARHDVEPAFRSRPMRSRGRRQA